MEKIFAINGKTYVAQDFTFNTVCDLEDMGIPIETMGDKPMSMIRAYFTLCTGRDKVYAGNELNSHLINGGKIDDLTNVMTEKMNNSDFFQALKSDTTESNPEIQTETETKTKTK